MTTMRYYEEGTGISLGRLTNGRRLATGAAILLTGLAIQLGNLF